MTSAFILSGDGINCERESARAFQEAGAKTEIVHVNELLKDPKILLKHQIFCIPGGFSFGDELRSGKILAEKMRLNVSTVLSEFTKNGGLTIGVCNGFQVLIQLGVFSKNSHERTETLCTNHHGRFLDRWVTVDVKKDAKNSPWFKGVHGQLMLPIRHKEGRVTALEGIELSVPLAYEEDINGSEGRAAALLDPTGLTFGLMPHPEAATMSFLNPMDSDFKEENAEKVRMIFKNSVEWGKSL